MEALASILIACGAVAMAGVNDVPPHGEIRAIEQRALDHRARIKSGIFAIDWQYTNLSKGVSESPVKRSVRIWVDGDSIRGDFARVYPQDSSLAGKTYRETISVHHGVLRHYSDEELTGGGRIATEILPLGGSHARTYTVPDPRLLGTNPVAFLNLVYSSLHQWIGKAASAPDAKVTVEDFSGEQAHRISFTLPDDVSASLWYYDKKLSAACIDVKQFDIRERADSRLGMIAGYGWFPSKVTYRRWEGGNLINEDVADVNVIQINEPIDSSVFDFPGMDLPLGTLVSDRTNKSNKQFVLTATGLREWKDDGLERGLLQPTKRSKTTILLIINGLIFLGLALYYIFRRGRIADGSDPAKA